MSKNLSSNISPDPLTVGNVVSAAFRLYRDRFRHYFSLSVQATLWTLLPILVLIPILFLIYNQASASMYWLLFPAFVVLSIYGIGNSVIKSALIARLTYQELMNQPETIQEGHRHLKPKFWILFRLSILMFLISVATVILSYFAIGFVGFILVFFGMSINVQNNIPGLILLSLLSLVVFIGLVIFVFRFFVRFLIVEVPLAVEDNLTASATIGRAWTLTQGYSSRLLSIVTVAFLITFPLFLIVQFLSVLWQGIMTSQIPISGPDSANFILIVSYLIGFLIGLLGNLVILPFWQVIKGVVYYDLRSRREGLGLQLRDYNT